MEGGTSWGGGSSSTLGQPSGFYVRATEFLPDERLRELAQCDDLSHITRLSFSVDTSENSLGDLGHRLPALGQLRLDGSNIATLRDLGTGLGGLRVLWLARSGLRELEGFGSLGALTELYLAFNEVEDLSPLMGAEQLQVLDLEGNAVTDPAQVHYLMGCEELLSLSLEGNPIADAADYRSQVLQALPQLAILDEETTERNALDEGGGSLNEPEPAPTLDSSTSTCALPAAPQLSSATKIADGGAAVTAARRRELRLVRDGIKYTDALRAYDVESHEALAMVCRFLHPVPAHLSSPSRSLKPSQSLDRSPSPPVVCQGPDAADPIGSSISSRGSTPASSLANAKAPRSPASSHDTMSVGDMRCDAGGDLRPSSSALASLRAQAASRPSSRAFTASAASSRLTTATSWRSSSRGTSILGSDFGSAATDDATSLLTFGDEILVCGNPTQALRAKREKRAAANASTSGDGDDRVDSADEPLLHPSARRPSSGPNSASGNGGIMAATQSVALAARSRRGVASNEPDETSVEAAGFLEALYRFKLETAIQGDLPDASSGASSDECEGEPGCVASGTQGEDINVMTIH